MEFPFVIPDKVYNVLKWIVMLVLPAISTAYFGLSKLWGWGHVEQIVGTIGIAETFFGTVLCISTIGYNKVTKNDSGEAN